MNTKYLSIFCLLALTMSGCAQHMAKDKGGTPPPTSTARQHNDASPTENAAPQTAKAQDTVPATDPAPVSHPGTTAQPASKAPQAKTPTSQDSAKAAKLLPLPPKEIVDAINRLTTLSRVRYLSRSSQYDYYVGGKLDARYDIKKSQLKVTNAPAEGKGSVTCEYSKAGKMNQKASDGSIKECNNLINELTTYLDR